MPGEILAEPRCLAGEKEFYKACSHSTARQHDLICNTGRALETPPHISPLDPPLGKEKEHCMYP